MIEDCSPTKPPKGHSSRRMQTSRRMRWPLMAVHRFLCAGLLVHEALSPGCPGNSPSRAPSSAYDAHGPPSRIVMPACQGAPTPRVSSPDHRLAATIRFMLPPNAPWVAPSPKPAEPTPSAPPCQGQCLGGPQLRAERSLPAACRSRNPPLQGNRMSLL